MHKHRETECAQVLSDEALRNLEDDSQTQLVVVDAGQAIPRILYVVDNTQVLILEEVGILQYRFD